MQSKFELSAYNPLSLHKEIAKLRCGKKIVFYSINCIAVHYPIPVPAGYFICYPALFGSGRILKNAIQCIPTRHERLDNNQSDNQQDIQIRHVAHYST